MGSTYQKKGPKDIHHIFRSYYEILQHVTPD